MSYNNAYSILKCSKFNSVYTHLYIDKTLIWVVIRKKKVILQTNCDKRNNVTLLSLMWKGYLVYQLLL